jgi:hypothetical protein
LAVDRPLWRAAGARERLHALALDRPLAVWLALGGLVAAAITIRVLLTRGSAAPWIMIDELIYSEFAKSLAAGEGWLNREQPAAYLSTYPVLIAPAWWAGSMATTFAVAKGVNAALMTLAIVPVFWWARRLVPTSYCFVAAGLVLLLPAYVLTGMMMTENAFFPAFVLALFALALALERPTALRQGTALAAFALALSMRYQGLVLAGIFPSAILVRSLLELRAAPRKEGKLMFLARELLRFWPIIGAFGVGGVGYAILKLAQGQPLASGLSAYGGVVGVSYSAEAVLRWTLLHVAELALAVAVAPFCALLLLLGASTRRSFATTAAERAFLAVAVTAVIWIAVQGGFFASQFAFRIVERNMFHVTPVFFLAFVLWLARGAPRPVVPTAVAVAVPLGLISYLAVENPLGLFVLSDAFSLVSVLELGAEVGEAWRWWIVGAGAFLLAAGFALLPRRFVGLALAPVVAAGLLSMFVVAYQRLTAHSQAVSGVPVVGDELSWVDDALGRDANVAFLYTPTVDPHALWQTEFWNRSIGPVFNIGVRELGHLPETSTTVDPATGELVPVPGQPAAAGTSTVTHVLTPRTHALRGHVAAQRGPWEVYAVEPPIRLATTTEGIASDGWMGSDASYIRYAPGNGNVGVRLSRFAWLGPDVPGEITVRIGDLIIGADGIPAMGKVTATRRRTIHSGGEETFLLSAPPPPFRVEVHIEPTFSPSDFGFADPRELGAVVNFRFFPE